MMLKRKQNYNHEDFFSLESRINIFNIILSTSESWHYFSMVVTLHCPINVKTYDSKAR